jgi:hypothetical protein
MALLRLRLVRPGLFDGGGRVFGFVGQAAFLLGDPGQFLGVLFQRIDTAAVVDDFLTFVEQAFQVHDIPLLVARCSSGAALTQIYACPYPGRYAGRAMTIPAGQNVQYLVPCASTAIVDVAIIGVVTEAVLVKSTVVV